MSGPHGLITGLKLGGLVLSLGLDTLAVSVGLGTAQVQGRERWRATLTFAVFEATMPLVGLLLGARISSAVGGMAAILGLVALLAIGAWMVGESLAREEHVASRVSSWGGLLLAAISVSLDELAVGFSLGLLSVPVVPAVILIGVQAFVFSLAGVSFGHRISDELADRGEMVAGLGLCGLALVLLTVRAVG